MTTGHPGGGTGWGSDEDPFADPGAYSSHEAPRQPTDEPPPYEGRPYDPLTDPIPGQEQPPPPGPTFDPLADPLADPAPQAYPGADYRPQNPPPEPDPYWVQPPPPPPPGRELDPETIGLRRPSPPPTEPEQTAEVLLPGGGRAARRRAARAGSSPATPAAPPPGGRAARRKAAAKAGSAPPRVPQPPPDAGRAARRKAAKAAAKAARQTGTAISNVIGELFITTGALLLLFVVYQLWWTNYEARAYNERERKELHEEWEQPQAGEGDSRRDPGAFSPGEGFAVLYIPTLDVVSTIAETTNESKVLDNGMVGHYSEEDDLPTAMPWDKEGNVGLAGHRNTHGEPFRYINQLQPGDPIVVETENTFYTYEMRSRLDSTSPSNTEVLDPIPAQGGFTEPGRYITLTTCTPEFTSTYRLIVWGEMVEERPRSEGLPDALVN